MLNLFRYAQGFLESAGEPLEHRYAAYIRVFASAAARELMIDPPETPFRAIDEAFRRTGADDALQRMLLVDLQTQLPDDLLLLTDKMSMATSLECRVPLLDHELVELGVCMPEGVKVRGGRLKHVMKEALADVLPPTIIDRKKRGFGTPMGAWLKGDLAPLLDRLLSRDAVSARGFFRPDGVDRLIRAHASNEVDGTDPLLSLLNFEIWSRIYLDRRAPDDVAAELREVMA